MFSLDGHSRVQGDILNPPVDELCLERVGFDETQFSFHKQIPTTKMVLVGCGHDARRRNVEYVVNSHTLSEKERMEWNEWR